MKTIRRVVISNVYADDNRGGAALTAAAIDAVRSAFPEARITALAVERKAARLPQAYRHTMKSYPHVDIVPAVFDVPTGPLGGARAWLVSLARLVFPRRASASESLRRLAEADLVVSRGGHIFVENERYKGFGLLALWMTAWPLLYAWRTGTPTVLLCTSIGPFTRLPSRVLNGFILRRMSLVLPRDKLSYGVALDLGVAPERVREVADSVFRSRIPTAFEQQSVSERYGLSAGTYGVVTVRTMGPRHVRDMFLDRLAATIRLVLDEESAQRIAVVVQVDGGRSGDADASQSLLDRLADDRATLVRDDLPFGELMALYSGARFLIGCRLHSTIFSLIGGTPAVCIALSGKKAAAIFGTMGLGEFVVDYPRIDPTHVAGLIRQLVEEGEAARARARAAAAASRERTRDLEALLQHAVAEAG